MRAKRLLHLDPHRCDGCGDCVTACAALGHPARLRVRSSAANPGANGALACCRHCERPLCAAVCPTACLQVGSNGVVLPRPERCVGCRLCLVACPLGGMVFDAQGKAGKCDLCLELVRRGHPPHVWRPAPRALSNWWTWGTSPPSSAAPWPSTGVRG